MFTGFPFLDIPTHDIYRPLKIGKNWKYTNNLWLLLGRTIIVLFLSWNICDNTDNSKLYFFSKTFCFVAKWLFAYWRKGKTNKKTNWPCSIFSFLGYYRHSWLIQPWEKKCNSSWPFCSIYVKYRVWAGGVCVINLMLSMCTENIKM